MKRFGAFVLIGLILSIGFATVLYAQNTPKETVATASELGLMKGFPPP